MPKDSRSFFEKLTGSVRVDKENEDLEPTPALAKSTKLPQSSSWIETNEEGELTVDVFQNEDEIIIQSTVAGVKPDDLDVSITQDMVTIKGKRQRVHEVSEKDFFYKELYWGSFSRSILLPQEVDSDAAQATIKNGLITIRLPKLDKSKTQRLKVKME
ncbi:Hsp20/alpha crystallin family protein [Candidatus Giovannonibacteria bacterium]|nr:Hsp20/alpha crystallin family protein [Candidatus Giovannonibacteria bacterium]